jgi:hypothetical protein
MGSMQNPLTPMSQFSDSDIPLEPTRLRAGDSWNWERSFPDYPASLYLLKYVFNSAANRFVLDGTLAENPPITADADGQTFLIQAAAATTAACPSDTYTLIAVLVGIAGTTSAGQQVTLPLQDCVVDPNIAAAAGPVDTRSIAKKNLDVINACLLGNLDPSIAEYTINGRMVRRFTRDELIKEREYWKNEYKAELRAQGLYTEPHAIGFRFKTVSM